jgi:ATP-dependent helicase/DNAse subunit B
VKATDPRVEPGEESEVMGFKLNKDGSVSGGWTGGQVRALCRLAEETAARLGQAMTRGEVQAHPTPSACGYCEYAAFCQRQLTAPPMAAQATRKELKDKLAEIKEDDLA